MPGRDHPSRSEAHPDAGDADTERSAAQRGNDQHSEHRVRERLVQVLRRHHRDDQRGARRDRELPRCRVELVVATLGESEDGGRHDQHTERVTQPPLTPRRQVTACARQCGDGRADQATDARAGKDRARHVGNERARLGAGPAPPHPDEEARADQRLDQRRSV